MESSPIKEFRKFVEEEINPAVEEIKAIKQDKSRQHLQKLIYTSLVDRFDSMVDTTIYANCRNEHFKKLADQGLKDNFTEKDMIDFLMESANFGEMIDNRLKAALRNSVARKRHAIKLQHLLEAFCPEYAKNEPRVTYSSGIIRSQKIKIPKISKAPVSVCGFADWLYSRRNAIVHGSGRSQLLKNDLEQIEKLWGRKPATSIKIKIGTTTIAANFYQAVCRILEGK